MTKLSVTIITLNEEANILRTLESVKSFADEIVVVDSMSADNTVCICTDFGCKVIQRKFDGYGTTKQFAVDQAKNDWIFAIDADEEVSAELQKEIGELFADGSENQAILHHAAYTVPRVLHFMGRIMKHSGVGEELLLRLFDRTRSRFTTVAVHESIETEGNIGKLRGRLVHYSYRDISHHIEKLNTYTTLAAKDYQKKSKQFSKTWAALKFPVSFFIFYVLKGGFRDGYPGFMWSFLAGVYGTLKVAKTIELSEEKPAPTQ
jgi:glycosyltransferase involved in cell wall biosynthesis